MLLLQCVSGSRAYGLDTAQSDTDIKGVFYLSEKKFFGLDYTEQVSSEGNDIVYYELKRFVELLMRNNPNILELLNTPHDCLLFKHPVIDLVRPEMFLSKLCLESFAGYAQSQIKKARGLNKKIFNPIDKERKNVSDFCYIIRSYNTIPLGAWLSESGYEQQDCGLVKIAHAKDIYALFHEGQGINMNLKGIYSGAEANDVSLSSIQLGLEPIAILSFNKDGYSTYCKDYREYWEWVSKRNDARYENTLEHGKNYDTKNMMHTFRLLRMSYEIATEKHINVRRTDRDFMFKIKNGAFLYDDLLKMADDLLGEIKEAYQKSDLQDAPDEQKVTELLYQMRKQLYK